MPGVMYLELGADYIDMVRPLWEGLNQHHLVRSTNFREHYEQMTFEARKKDLLKRKNLRIIMAAREGHPVGYCICSREDEAGEIESIFVEEAYRRSGIGEELMNRALAWLDAGGVKKKVVAVAAGNEAAIPFYESFGFLPRMTVLQMSQENRPAD